MGTKIKPTDHMIQTLRMIQSAGHTSAIIAGGAIRDTVMDVMVNDVDIFIQSPSHIPSDQPRPDCLPAHPFKHEEWLTYWARVLKLDTKTRSVVGDRISWHYSAYTPPADHSTETFKHSPSILSVWNVFRGFNMYQLIFTTSNPVEYVEEKFDFGICKAYCDGTRVRLTRDFVTDSRNRTITLVGKELTARQVEYAVSSHFPRIQEKYPGYKLIIPAEYITITL